MYIGIDIDSVIAEVMPSLLQFFNKIYNTHFTKRDHTTYYFASTFNISLEEVLKELHAFYDSKYFELVKPVRGAKKGVQFLSKKHRLSAITSRPYYVEEKTIRWLDKYFPKQFSTVHHTNQVSHANEPKKKKSEICQELGIELLIDDHLDFATDVASVGIPVLLFNQPWNQTDKLPKGVRRVQSWKEISKML